MDKIKKMAIIGASRGLGRSISEAYLTKNSDVKQLLVSRKIDSVDEGVAEVFRCDLSNVNDQKLLLGKITEFLPDQIFYCAGGGPYGKFESKNMKDHQWAFEVNFLFPAKLLHFCLNQDFLKRIIFIGSAIAETKPDPMASSYAAAKHALRGLITSVQAEKPKMDIRLFSPGYMDTEMLPKNAWPRESKERVQSPDVVAQELLNWLTE